MQLLTADKVDLLESQGFEIAEFSGFESHSIPLYAHRPISDKQPGDVVLRARVGNPDTLDDAEAAYLARKAYHGMFPWLPGAECVRRTFVDVTVEAGRSANGSEVKQSAGARGCKWCRKGRNRRRRAGRADSGNKR